LISVREKEFAMPPRVLPLVEQLEARCVLSVAAAPAVHPTNPAHADVHDTQAILAVVQLVRGNVARIDATLPIAIAGGMAALPAGFTANAPPSPPVNVPPTVLPLEPGIVPDVATASESLDVAHVEKLEAPAAEPVASLPVVVVVTTAEQELDFIVARVAETRTEPVRVPSIPLDRPVHEPAAAEPMTHDHLPLLVWMVGIASVAALHAERRRSNAVYV
jgi:hypothetical protein